jgi:hypothetical protein
MAIPTWTVGEVLTSSDVNTWLVPRHVTKPSDQSATSTTTLADDTDLQFTVSANAEYEWNMLLTCTGATINTGDVKFTFTWPAGAVGKWYGDGFAVAAGSPSPAVIHVEDTSGSAHAFGVDGSGLSPVRVTGRVTVSSTAGTLKLRWAQNTSNATATKVLAGSAMTVRRVG